MSKKAFLFNRRILLEFPFDMTVIKEVKGLTGCEFRSKVSKTIRGKKQSKKNVWLIDCDNRNIKRLEELKFDINKRIYDGAEAKKVVLKPVGAIAGLNATLYPFQSDALSYMEATNGRTLLALDMGLGKSITSLAHYQREIKKNKKLLIICPSCVKYNWEKEVSKFLNKNCQILNGKTPFNIKGDIVIINYSIVDSWKKDLKKYDFDMIICDEVHYLANTSSKRSKAVKAIAKKADSVVGLTGSPIKSKIAQLYNPLSIINKEIFPNKMSFEKRYCDRKKTPWGFDVSGSSNLRELHEILVENVMFRRKKEDVLKDLPRYRRIPIPIQIPMEEYNKIQFNFEQWLKENKKATAPSILAQISPLRMEVLDKKLDFSIEWIENFLESGEKLVVFCVHKKGVARLMEKFGNIAVKVDGSVTAEKKQKAVDKFVKDKKTKLFVANIQSGSTGISDLQLVCNNMLFVEYSFVPSDIAQAIARLVRIGQKNSSNIYEIVAENTIDEHIRKVLGKKEKVIGQAVDGEEKVSSTGSIVNDLLKSFK